MTTLADVDEADLRAWFAAVSEKESAQWLSAAIAHKRGVDIDELADWYDLDAGEIRDEFRGLAQEPIVVTVARWEGLDLADLAEQHGLSIETIRNWLRDLADIPIEDAADVIDRYKQRSAAPVIQPQRSRIEYINYEVIEENGWSVGDDDLFEKANQLSLPSEDYGRVLVEAGETILEAVEKRGLSWPYTCRGGACSNCAVLVKEGDIAMPGDHVLTDDQVTVMNARLTCVGVPVTERIKLIMNIQHLDEFEGLRLPSPSADLSQQL